MKKIHVFFTLSAVPVFIMTAFLSGCNANEEPARQNDCDVKIAESYNSGNWVGRVSYELAVSMADGYQKDNSKAYIWSNNKITKEEDAQCVWFPLDEIKKYLRAIEKGDCEKKCGDSLGIRIYYAKYPEANAWTEGDFKGQLADNVEPGYANHHTVFFVPTYYDKNTNAHVDFNPFGRDCKNPFVSQDPKQRFVFMAGSVKNHGSLIPPNAPQGASFISE